MAGKAILELDKSFKSDVGENYGEMKIRVVVLKKKTDTEGDELEPQEEDDDLAGTGKKPTDGFLESPKRGKECCVFIINGQRQDAWDDTFIVRDLGLKYLRHRTLIVVDLDGLKPEAIAEIMQGSRQGFYQGTVYHAISKRLIATLKKDPDLDQLQKEAEQNLLDAKSADEAVKNKLDQLIDGHHTAAEADGPGGESGQATADGPVFSPNLREQSVVTRTGLDQGLEATLPVLVTNPNMVAVRMHADEASVFYVLSEPATEWSKLEDFSVRLQPAVNGLVLSSEKGPDRARIKVLFTEPDDMEADEYPLSSELLVFARFKGHPETRMLKMPVVIVRRPGPRPPKKERVLRPDPTYLRVVSRQPVKLIPGSASLHVKLVWDGEDQLLIGSPPPWGFRARCLSLATFPNIGFAFGRGGRLSALLDTPTGLLPGSDLDFQVEAIGPGGKILSANFKGRIEEPTQEENSTGPRKIASLTPGTMGQRRPPYKLIYVQEDKWSDFGCWVDANWTSDDVGCFHEPTPTAPLILVLNEDFAKSHAYFKTLIGKLEESTINERKNKYYSHVAFHLYQMFLAYRRQMDASARNPDLKPPEFPSMRAEVNRVGTTLIKLMEVR